MRTIIRVENVRPGVNGVVCVADVAILSQKEGCAPRSVMTLWRCEVRRSKEGSLTYSLPWFGWCAENEKPRHQQATLPAAIRKQVAAALIDAAAAYVS